MCDDLRVLKDLLGVLLIAVYVEPDGRSCTACATETEDESGAIREDYPQALRERERAREREIEREREISTFMNFLCQPSSFFK